MATLTVIGAGFAFQIMGCGDDAGAGGGGGGTSTTSTTSSTTTSSAGPTTVTCMASGTAGSAAVVCIPPIDGGGGGSGGAGGGGGGIPASCPSVEDATPLIEQVERHVLIVSSFSGVNGDGECCYNILHDLCY